MTPYRLGINVSVNGRGLGGLGGASRGFGSAGAAAARGAGGVLRFNAALGSMGRQLFSVNGLIGGLVAALAGGALFNALVSPNSALEQQTIGMTGLINANLQFVNAQGKVLTSSQNFQASMKSSNQLINQFRRDALKGAGTTNDRIMTANATINAVTGAAAGNLETLRKLASEVVTVSKLVPNLRNDAGQAARDAQQILEGRAGSEVQLFQFLNKQLGGAEAFNKLAAPERLARFRQALSEFATDDLIKAQANSFDGLTSSLGDFWQLTTQTLGGPLFGRIKTGLQTILDTLIDAKGNPTAVAMRLQKQVEAVGEGIARGFDGALKFGRDLYDFAQQYIIPAINKVSPSIEKLGAVILSLSPSVATFKMLSENAASVWPVIEKIIGFATELGTIIATAVTPIVEYFTATFAEGFAVVQGWLLDNQPLVNDFVDGLKMTVDFGAKVVAWAAGFMATGIGVFLLEIGAAVITVFAGFKRLNDFLSKFGIIGLIKGIGAAMLDMKNSVLNALDSVLLGFLNTISSLPGADLIGVTGARDTVQRRIDSRTFETANAYNDAMPAGSSGDTNVTVNQTITTSDPQAAAASSSRGVTRAVAAGQTGAPITANPLVNP